MIKPSAILCGYTRFITDSKDARDILNDANRIGIQLYIENGSADAFVFYVIGRKAKNIAGLLQKRGAPYTARIGGIPQFIRLHRHRVGVFLGILFYLFLTQFSAQFVWHISVVGNQTSTATEIVELLAQNGVYVGAYGKNIDAKAVCGKIQMLSPNISWMTIHHTGSYYTVEIVEREQGTNSGEMRPYYNVVASRDGQVESLDIKSGRAVASPGTTVQKGDLLVSGIIQTRTENTKFESAAATVLAKVEDVFSMEIPYKTVNKAYLSPVPVCTEVKFFGKTILILKKAFKTDESYDTIYTEKNIDLDCLSALPVVFCETTIVPYLVHVTTQSADALLSAARADADQYIAERQYAEILGSEEVISYTDEGIRYVRNITAVENIAAVSEFSLQWTAERE